MHYDMNNIADLVRTDITTIKVIHYGQKDDKLYTYKCLTRLADGLDIGDTVIVRNARGYVPVIIKQFDEQPDIDPDADFHLRWAFQKLNVEVVDSLEAHENRIANRLRERRKQQLAQQAIQSMGIHNTDPKQLNYDEGSSDD